MSDDRVLVLLEDMQGKMQGFAESFDTIEQRLNRLEETTGQILEIVTDVAPTKAAVIDHNAQLDDHEDRLQTLEMPIRA